MSAPRPAAGDYALLLGEIGAEVPETVVIDAGLGTSMQTALFAERFPRRYFNVGIAEQHAVGLASGLARAGYVPLVHSFSNFLARRAHDQVAVSVAWPECNVKLIAGSCGVHDGRNGPSHMAIDDLGTMAALPGIQVVEPGDARQTDAMLRAAVRHRGPVYFRLRRFGLAADLHPGGDPEAGTSWIERPPSPALTLVACGTMLEWTVEAAAILADHGIAADLLHVAALRPLDSAPIVESARRTGRVVTVENHAGSNGFGAAVSRVLGPLGVRIGRLALPDRFLPAGGPQWQSREAGLSPEDIAIAAAAFVEGN